MVGCCPYRRCCNCGVGSALCLDYRGLGLSTVRLVHGNSGNLLIVWIEGMQLVVPFPSFCCQGLERQKLLHRHRCGASKKKKDPVFVPRWYRVEEGKEEGSRAGSAPSLDLSELDDGIVAARHTVHLEEMKVAYESAKKEAKLKKEKEKEERSKARGGAARGR